MKKLSCIVPLILVILISSCSKENQIVNQSTEPESEVDTFTATTAYPVSIIHRVNYEIGEKNDTTILYAARLLKVRTSSTYCSYFSYTESSIDSVILKTKIPKNYCLVITGIRGRRENDDSSIVTSFQMKKIVNHMGG